MSGKVQVMMYSFILRSKNWQDPFGNNFNSIQHEPLKCSFWLSGSVSRNLS